MSDESEIPAVYLVTRTDKGLSVWLTNQVLLGRKFQETICDNNLLLDEVDLDMPGIRVCRNNKVASRTVWQTKTLAGPRWGRSLKILPTIVDGKYAFIIPDIPDLTSSRIRFGNRHTVHDIRRRYQPDPPAEPAPETEPASIRTEYATPDPFPWPVEPNGAVWTTERIKAVLETIKEVEERTGYRLLRDDRGKLIFTRPPIEL